MLDTAQELPYAHTYAALSRTKLTFCSAVRLLLHEIAKIKFEFPWQVRVPAHASHG